MARRKTQVDGLEVLPGLNPMHRLGFPYFGMEFLDANFVALDDQGTTGVEVRARIGLLPEPYTLVLSIDQAYDANVIQRTND